MSSSENPSLIIRTEKRKLSVEAKVNLPSDEALTKTIKRKRYIENEGESFDSLDFKIPTSMSMLGDKKFVIDDVCNKDTNDRIIVFSHERLLGLMCNSKIIIIDGTFQVVPKLFQQLYTIHATVVVIQ